MYSESLPKHEKDRVRMTAMAASRVLRAYDAQRAGDARAAEGYMRDADECLEVLPADTRLSDLDIVSTLHYEEAAHALNRR